ncbi:MAG: hypothetical protein ILP02_01300, partial [Clostridia bacterium]|nr:hypothetical protein [Clostridia bacterium]
RDEDGRKGVNIKPRRRGNIRRKQGGIFSQTASVSVWQVAIIGALFPFNGVVSRRVRQRRLSAAGRKFGSTLRKIRFKSAILRAFS